MDLAQRQDLVTRSTEEIITLSELRTLLEEKKHPSGYWGFEPSGPMHLGTGLVCGYKILDLVKAGFDFTIFLADWHAWINNKLGGNLENIRLCGEYFKHCFTSIGLTPDKVRFLWASELVQREGYWETVLNIARHTTVPRIIRCLPIMGREATQSEVEVAALYYPCMQTADIFSLDVDCACAGIDQRKAHMLARDIAEKLRRKKPISIHTHLLLGLRGPGEKMGSTFDENESYDQQIRGKMSKSLLGSSIYIHDSADAIREKIKTAYCPPRVTANNPILEIARYILFPGNGKLTISRSEKYGGNIDFDDYSAMETSYLKGSIHPLDLKNSVAEALIEALEPVRRYFETRPGIVENIMKLEVTR